MNLITTLITGVPFALIWLGIVVLLRRKGKAGLVYLFFFTVFSIYIFKVLDYTLFQFQSLLLLKYFMPNLMLNGQAPGNDLNLVPLITLTSQDLKTSLLNILLFVPFGFGLPFVTKFRMLKVIVIGLLFSIAIEVLQLVTGLLAGTTFRIADINDVIFNTAGTAIGYLLFVGFTNLFRRAYEKGKMPETSITSYIAEL